ncbi:DUF3027 domain-containing protein [Nocardia brasiliensis]|uniref:DUF3027 domain-containing protein n=1 Tax=Nocardia brasiliensis TaxID=37326 RepID=A0A6G9XKV0_NOCBR|nr:DUF3027 domain-containing protein [Nocardia brasiliensis]QIS01561.1 DUF3027 domain-containing protein [Nocardia brasiliensis]
MSAVSVSESGVRPILADAVDLARRALLELEPAGVGAHLGVAAEDESAATHRFEATLPGYRGWQWAVVVAAPPQAEYATVSESALLPGPDALVAPDFVPWDQRIRPGDLAPGDLLAPQPNDPRLVPGYVANGDPVVDEVALEIGLGRTQVMSLEGRADAAERWHAEYGPDTEMAKAAPSTCGLCGFYLPLAGSLRAAFGVCGNAMGADGRVVHAAYGCGAHSDTVAPTGGGSPLYEAYDDAAVELIPNDSLRGAEAGTEPADAGAGAAADDASAITATAQAGAVAAESADATTAATGVTESAKSGVAAAESGDSTTADGTAAGAPTDATAAVTVEVATVPPVADAEPADRSAISAEGEAAAAESAGAYAESAGAETGSAGVAESVPATRDAAETPVADGHATPTAAPAAEADEAPSPAAEAAPGTAGAESAAASAGSDASGAESVAAAAERGVADDASEAVDSTAAGPEPDVAGVESAAADAGADRAVGPEGESHSAEGGFDAPGADAAAAGGADESSRQG